MINNTAKFQVHKVSALPAQAAWKANDCFVVVDSVDATLCDVYFVNKTGDGIRHTPTRVNIQDMIDLSLSGFNQTEIVADIAARNTLGSTLNKNTSIWVIDATGDTTVASGAALYLFKESDGSFTKISEAESMDVVVDWSAITNKPTSTVTDIDDAVTKRHVHDNKSVIDKFTADTDGDVLFDGKPIGNALATNAW
jgi:hypothetical protein